MKERIERFEIARCEQIHSSINQFVVFEKFAEQNNKYDVNNFSKLIDTFDLKEEVRLIQENLQDFMHDTSRVPWRQTIFDPVVKPDKTGNYSFSSFKGRKYDLENISHKLLSEPPNKLVEHVHKDEVINFILDKAFVMVPLKHDFLSVLASSF